MASRSRIRINGFSLLELIVTIAVLSVGIVAVLQAVSYSLRVSKVSSDIMEAVIIGSDKLQELEYKEAYSLIPNEPKESQDQLGKFNWLVSLEDNAAVNLYKLNFSINWNNQLKKEGFTVETYLRK